MLSFFTILPLAAAFLSALIGKHIRRAQDFLTGGVCLSLFLFSLGMIGNNRVIVSKIGSWMPPLGICVVADGLTVFMLGVVNLISFLVMVYSASYMREYTDKWKFHSLFLFMLAGMNGVIISGDLFNLYVFLEVASISGYALVAFGVEPEDLEASFKYAIMGALASIFILFGVALLYGYTSTLNMSDIALVLSNKPRGILLGFISVLFLAGFSLKSALVPFHAWLPDAHSSAPSPVSAMLSGVFIKTLGIYAMIRIFFNVLGVSKDILFVLMLLGVISMVTGAILAIGQNDIKRMFAYSSISQIGYIIFAFGVGTPLAIFGGLFHLFNHAVFKSLLFLNAGAIEYSTGNRDLDRMGGLNKRLAVTGFTSFFASMSISGVPPLGGFWSKLIIIIAALEAGQFGFAAVLVLVSILTLGYYMKFQTLAFFGQLSEAWAGIKEVPFTMKFSMVTLAIICAVSGLALVPQLRFVLQSAVSSLLTINNY